MRLKINLYALLLLSTLMAFLLASDVLAEARGSLIAGRQTEAQYLDGNVATSDRSLNSQIFGSMYYINSYDGKYLPRLAESYEVLDSKTWKFNLRKGVKFHNGTEATSEDVKFSFDRSMGKFSKKFRGYRKGPLKKQIAAIETPDKYTVIIKTKFADASFLGVAMLLQVVPKDYVQKMGDKGYARKPIGFGPYKVTEIKVGEHIKYEAFEDYYNQNPGRGEGGPSKLKQITFRTLPREATMIAAIKAGEIDAMYGVNIDSVKDLESLSNLSLYYAPAALHGFYILNSRSEKDPKGKPNPLWDVRVRRALNHAINWDDIIKNYMTGREWRTTLIGRTQVGYTPDVPLQQYDPEKAKKLLAEAGYADGLSLSFHYNEATRQPYQDGIWQYWQQVGININPKPHSRAVHLRGVYRKKHDGIIAWGGGYGPDPGNWFRVMTPYKGFQAMHPKSKKVVNLARQQSVEFDKNKRNALIKELNTVLLEEAWFVPTVRGVGIAALNTNKYKYHNADIKLTPLMLTRIEKK